MYKIIEGALISAPKAVEFEGKQVFNPKDEILIRLGYKPLTEAEPPQCGANERAVAEYTETEAAIEQSWRIEPLPEPEPTEAERLEAVEAAILDIAEVVYSG